MSGVINVELGVGIGNFAQRAAIRVKKRIAGSVVRYVYSSLKPSGFSEYTVEDKLLASYRRACMNIYDRVLALGAYRMLTLTYRENFQDLATSRQHLKAWVRKVRRFYKGFKYVAVAERQKRGAVHWHIAIDTTWFDIGRLRLLWCEVVGDGNCDLKKFNGRAAHDIARYISKYLGKGFGDDLGDKPRYAHFYHVARGLKVDVLSIRVYGATSETFEEWLMREVGKDGLSVMQKTEHLPYRESGSLVCGPSGLAPGQRRRRPRREAPNMS